jgi:hypothetical protein
MQRRFLRVRLFNDLRNPIKCALVGDQPRHLLVTVDLGVEFDALPVPARVETTDVQCEALESSSEALGQSVSGPLGEWVTGSI